MTTMSNAPPENTELDELRSRNAELEKELRAADAKAAAKIAFSELKAEAIRLGIVDLDGLQFVDTSAVKLDELGRVTGAAPALTKLRKDKPWLFNHSSSSTSAAPASQSPRTKLATEMTVEEWRVARADLLKRR